MGPADVPSDLVRPMLVPPTAPGGSWARTLGERAAAFYVSPQYIQYAQQRDPYVFYAELGAPFELAVTAAGTRIPLGPATFDVSSLFHLSDGEGNFFGVVHTRPGDVERPDVSIADPLVTFQFPDQSENRPASDLPPLVPDGPLEAQLHLLLPNNQSRIEFLHQAFGATAQDPLVFWQPSQPCTASQPGWAASVDAVDGHVEAVRIMPPGMPGCEDPDPFLAAAPAFDLGP